MGYNLQKSIDFWEKCKNVIPAGSSTLAKSPSRLSLGNSPFYAISAAGSHFIDIDGNSWLDCEMAMGSVVWGHCREEVNLAILSQLRKGIHYSIPSMLEYEYAERLLSRFPHYHAAKFFTNGADAVYACVRAARFSSGREMTLSCEYHGWLDWCSPTYYHCSPEKLGITKATLEHHISCYGGVTDILTQIRQHGCSLAAVVLCPANYTREDLRLVLTTCQEYGVFTVFDEVTSGCRFAKGGVTTAYALSPDFLCLSKGLTNGLPLAVAMGQKEHIMVMEQLKISSAHAGWNLAFAAALACEDLLIKAAHWPSWEQQTDGILQELSNILRKLPPEKTLKLSGNSGCFSIVTPGTAFWNDPFRMFMMRYLAHHRIFSKGYILFSDAHSEKEIDFVGACLMKCIDTYISNS